VSSDLQADRDAFVAWGKDAAPAQQAPVAPPTRRHRMAAPIGIGALIVAVVVVVIVVVGGSSRGSTNGVAAEQPAAILVAARSAIASASAVRVTGSGENAGQPVSLVLQLAAGVGAKGTLTMHGAAFDIVAVGGGVYMKGPAAAWQAVSGSAAAGALFGGRWLEVSSGQFSSIAQLTSLSKFFGKLLSVSGLLVKGPSTTVRGQSAVEVEDPSQRAVVYVATTGPAYPVKVIKPGPQGGTYYFDRFDEPLLVSKPAGVVDLAQIDGGSTASNRTSSDAAAEELAHTAQVVAETYATDNNGSYSGLTATILQQYESTIQIGPGNGNAYIPAQGVKATTSSYSVTAAASDGTDSFSITRNANGSIVRTCHPAGQGDCQTSGAW
jgi:hypothetical protein